MIGRVYKVEVNENDIYIGSTIQSLKERERLHNISLEQNIKKYKLYEKCRENNITKISCVLIEEKEIKDIKDIRLLEQEYIDELNPSLNHNFAYITEEYKKDYKKDYHKEWSKNNREKLKENKKEYRENNREKIKEYGEKWRENNKEYDKEWYNKNKDKLLEKVKCDICNLIVCKKALKRHQKGRNCIPI